MSHVKSCHIDIQDVKTQITNFVSHMTPTVMSLRSKVNEIDNVEDRYRVLAEYQHVMRNDITHLLSIMYDDAFKTSLESRRTSLDSRTQTGVAVGEISSYLRKLTLDNTTYEDMMKIVRNGIRMIKHNIYGLTHEQKNHLISHVNKYIMITNWYCKISKTKPCSGIILQLRKTDPNDRCEVTSTFKVRCRVCGKVVFVNGLMNQDIYAPPYCPSCTSANLIEEAFVWEEYVKNDNVLCCGK